MAISRKEYKARYRREHSEQIAAYNKGWTAANPEKVKEYNARYRAANPEKDKEYSARYRAANPEKVKEYNARYRAENPEKKNAHTAKWRAAKKQAVPKWADLEGIQLFYWLARQMNRVIDHIVPLQHPLVCGLHTMDNLQMLTASDNNRKNNYFEI